MFKTGCIQHKQHIYSPKVLRGAVLWEKAKFPFTLLHFRREEKNRKKRNANSFWAPDISNNHMFVLKII